MLNTFKRSGLKEDSIPNATFYVYGWEGDEALRTRLKEANSIKAVLHPPLDRIEVGKEEPCELHKIYGSIGIPLQGLVNALLQINLLPFEMRKKVRQIGKPLFIGLTSLALALTLTWGAGAIIRYRNESNSVNDEIKKRRPEVEAVTKLQKQKDECCKELSELEKIRVGEVSKTAILEELTKILPDTVWIWNFKYNGKEIEISGFADSASNLIPLLDKSPLFEKVEFLAPVTKEKLMRGSEMKESERFKIKARIEGR
jgi:general secretion pathway protein L